MWRARYQNRGPVDSGLLVGRAYGSDWNASDLFFRNNSLAAKTFPQIEFS
jgi:hypothetical protein